ncbi:phage head-tail connector protein [Azospirillum sp. TSO22-1]|uniref:phage head-tail connector protein n=1 Tax=Azospirillum sp. TSO22-1 TaxID=716789 RepID=UPI000D616BB7|nr:phage head-tail connector protein [Azospirillum sp. TSO22-1]PWC53271.1 hypothetical protein TSO221_11385 [Azospirillum sp. TSO22-1]
MLTVVTPAASQQLTTLTAVKTELKLSGTTDDGWLGEVIDRASAAVRNHCNRIFALETVRETFRLCTPTDSLILTRWPVVSIVSVTESGTTVATSGYEVEADTGILYRLTTSDRRRCWASPKIVVEYQAGYTLPGTTGATLPDDVERATMMLVKAEWYARTRDPLVKAENVDSVLETTFWVGGFGTGATLPPDVVALLSPHRQPVVG